MPLQYCQDHKQCRDDIRSNGQAIVQLQISLAATNQTLSALQKETEGSVGDLKIAVQTGFESMGNKFDSLKEAQKSAATKFQRMGIVLFGLICVVVGAGLNDPGKAWKIITSFLPFI